VLWREPFFVDAEIGAWNSRWERSFGLSLQFGEDLKNPRFGIGISRAQERGTNTTARRWRHRVASDTDSYKMYYVN
jgi:hypothetical protein